jgi:peptide/nickel transport system ATP-binding protein
MYAETETPLALSLSDLRVVTRRGEAIVEDVSLTVGRGEILGLVGESGSGKTTTALSIFGYTSAGAKIEAIDLRVGDTALVDESTQRQARGRLVSYVPQNPGTALNPSLRVAQAVADMIRAHREVPDVEVEVLQSLAAVNLPATPEFGRRYPHQMSGGQQQRVCIAAALACGSALVVLDEPTTGLDVVTQAHILAELVRLRDQHRLSLIYVTHDLAVVAQIADRVAVMYAGRIVEQGPLEDVLRRPRHPYTRGLLSSIPDHVAPRKLQPMPGIAVGVGDRPAGCAFAARCPQHQLECDDEMPGLETIGPHHLVRCLEWAKTPELSHTPLTLNRGPENGAVSALLEVEHLRAEYRSRREVVTAAADVSFSIPQGACLALVGESGSGKTTIARTIAGLHAKAGGSIRLEGQELGDLARRRSVEQRRRVQIVFQNPADALNPRHNVTAIVSRPARALRGLKKSDAEAEVKRLLEAVRLPARLAERYPEELSGGERQRVSIARALAAAPDLLVCDEVTSALDVSVQAAVLDVLQDLRRNLGLTMLFISHDLGVVATIADKVIVLEDGLICEEGLPEHVLVAPSHPYTQRLLAAAPSVTTAQEDWENGRETAVESN